MKAYYCAGTHWDREWYESFQEFRMWLVELIDELIELMERDSGYECFHLDGQAVVIEDYLAIRPEKRERLLKLLNEGRIVAGPWYVLPDEWLISGESYIRNIMTGMKVCRDIGFEPMNFAYTPDQFGHIAALPTIMTGLGLQAGICWRGTQDEHYPAHFMWEGPDGAKMPTFKLRDDGSYAPFLFKFRNQLKDSNYDEKAYEEHFAPYLKEETERGDVPLVLLLDAIDHFPADEKMVSIFDELQKRHPDVEFVWSSLEEYGTEMVKHAAKMPVRKGELRQPCLTMNRGGQYLIVHTISSRYPLKLRNDECQALLEKWVEPFTLFQQISGGEPVLNYLDLAWEYVLKNHPHDSICGCSIDQVHRDMHYRFDQCSLLADGLVRRAMNDIAKASDSAESLTSTVIHNPLPFPRKGVFDVAVPLKADWEPKCTDGLTTGERLSRFRLVSKDGKQVPFQLSRVEHGTNHKRIKSDGRYGNFGGDVYHLAVEMDLPACGYTGFRVESTEKGMRNHGSLLTGPLTATADEVVFTLHPDGTALLTDARSGRTYDKLFLYEDTGDAGDGWTRGQLINDIIFRSPGTRVTTGVDEDGPLRTIFRVEREFDLPTRMNCKTNWRSEDRMTIRVTDLIYVEKSAAYVRVKTRVENTCMDHRFRVLFPTRIDTEQSFAETPFAVVNRDIDIPDDCADWHERVNPEKAFTSFFGVADARGGLAVLAPKGLHEYEVTQTPHRTLALTLFRSTLQTVGTAGEPDGQLIEPMEFEYLLYAFAGHFNAVDALKKVAEGQTGVRSHQTDELPADHSFLHFEEGDAVVTAIKPAEDGQGGIIRLWNPTDTAIHDRLFLNFPVESVECCDLKETPTGTVTPEGKRGIPFCVPARGITTLRFTLPKKAEKKGDVKKKEAAE